MNDYTHGVQFRASFLKVTAPTTVEGIEKYLGSGMIRGPDARYQTLHKGHLMFVRPEEGRFVTADLIRTLTSSGTAPELRDRIRRLKEAGYNEVVVQVTPGHDTMIDEWARVFEIV